MEKIAIIEMGADALRLMILKVRNSHYEIVEEMTEFIQIGKEVEKDGMIKSKNIGDAITVLKLFRKMSETYSVTRTVAIATNILKDAKNQKSFLEEIYNNTGINFVVLSDEDEIKTVYNGVINSIDSSKGYIINISANKTNIIKYNRRSVITSFTIDDGAISLAEKFSNNPKPEDMIDYIKAILETLDFGEEIDSESIFIGSGSTFISLGRLARKISRYSLDLENNYQISKELFNQVFDFTKTLDIDKTKKLKGISEERADSLLSGFCIIKAILEKFELEEITVTTASVREGLIYSNITSDYTERFSDMLGHSLENFKEFLPEEIENNAQVYNLAILLFKQLKVMHKLPRYYVKPLRIASFMYDCGKRVCFDNFAKHGFYIILNSGICGATQKELLLASFICLCQDLDNFNLADWLRYKDILTEEDLDAVRKLGVIVKLASCLDSSKKSIVDDISCDILGDSVIMKTIVRGDPSFEILQGMKVAGDYKKVFKKYLQII